MSARTYVVGLPVVVTVHDDGRVEYDVDTSEAGSEIRGYEYVVEAGRPAPQRVLDADGDLVDADHDRRRA